MDEATSEREHLRLAARVAGIEPASLARPRSRARILRGLRFHYLDWGARGRPAVVFLHGGLLSARTWDLVCLALRGEYRCLALDQRGHGDSEWSPELDYAPATNAADVVAFADALRVERFALVGQSMGGLHALEVAARAPGRVAGIAVVDVPATLRMGEGFRRLRAFSAEPLEGATLEDLVERAVRFNPRRDPRLLRRSLRHNLRRAPDGAWMWKYDARFARGGLGDLGGRLEQACASARAVTCPALVVHGADSAIASEADTRALAALVPRGAWTQVADAGHNVQGDNPKGLVETLRPFLAQAFASGAAR